MIEVKIVLDRTKTGDSIVSLVVSTKASRSRNRCDYSVNFVENSILCVP